MEYLLCRSTFFARLAQLVNFISPNYAYHEPTSYVVLFTFLHWPFSCPILQSMHSALCPSALVEHLLCDIILISLLGLAVIFPSLCYILMKYTYAFRIVVGPTGQNLNMYECLMCTSFTQVHPETINDLLFWQTKMTNNMTNYQGIHGSFTYWWG